MTREEGKKSRLLCFDGAGDLFTGYTVNFLIERTVKIINETF